MNRNLFKAEAVKRGYKMADVANLLGIAENTLYRKLGDVDGEFTQSEIAIIRAEWKLSNKDVIDIFFN